jgi:hypothetical protein
MSQIITKVLKQGTKHSKIISCSFFTMEDAYRSFEKYQRHLQNLLIQIKRNLPDFEVRIYTDDTGSEYALKISMDPNITVIHFDCPEFREGLGHIGTFGTFARFLPLFEEHEYVYITDIDLPDDYLKNKVNQEDITIYTQICYDRKVYGRNYTILAGTFGSRIQLPRALLTRFLNKVSDGDYEKERDALNAANKYKPPSPFPYGMDELFLNWPVYDWIKKRDYSINANIDYADPVLLNIIKLNSPKDDKIACNYYKTGDKKYFSKLKEVFSKYIHLGLEKYPCLKLLDEKLKDPKSFKTDFFERVKIKSSEL